MKTGCLVEGRGGDLVQRAFASLLDPTACQDRGRGRIPEDRESWCSHGRQSEGGRYG